MIELKSLSQMTGCKILAKQEYMNPGGSIKARAALQIILDAEESGQLKPGGTICEASGGNTAIALAIIAAEKGYKFIVTMRESVSKEKIENVEKYGGKVVLCPDVHISDYEFYQHKAARLA